MFRYKETKKYNKKAKLGALTVIVVLTAGFWHVQAQTSGVDELATQKNERQKKLD
jgi:hypothetical protein